MEIKILSQDEIIDRTQQLKSTPPTCDNAVNWTENLILVLYNISSKFFKQALETLVYSLETLEEKAQNLRNAKQDLLDNPSQRGIISIEDEIIFLDLFINSLSRRENLKRDVENTCRV